jgi:predicted phosphodiesterase
LADRQETETDIGKVSFQLTPSWGGKIVGYVPVTDWGVRFKTFPLPLTVTTELRSLDRSKLIQVAANNYQISAIENDMKSGFQKSLLINFLCSFAVLLFLLAVSYPVWKKAKFKWLTPVVALPTFLVVAAAGVLFLHQELKKDLLDKPVFYASGAELQRILNVVDNAKVDSPYGSEFTNIVKGVSTVLATGQIEQPSDQQSLYLVSDLHANPLVIKPVSDLVDKNPVLFVGDFGQQGGNLETDFLRNRVAAIGTNVVAVSGNHDSEKMMKTFATEGVTVLNKNGTLNVNGKFAPPLVHEVNGIKIAGLADPLEYSDDLLQRQQIEKIVETKSFQETWTDQAVEWFYDLEETPDVVMIHQNSLASMFASKLVGSGWNKPLTIATGHTHQQSLEKNGSVTIVNSGTIGAGGVFETGETGIGLAHLLFNSDGSLRVSEFLLVEPFSGAAQANRIEISSFCENKDKCLVEISPELIGR